MELPQSKNELEIFLNTEEFIIQTCQQIAKDLVGLISFTPNLDIDLDGDVLRELSDKMAHIFSEMSSQNLQQFIYKVDIKESAYLQAMAQDDKYQNLAFLAVRREAQKVFLRAHFSQKG